MADRCTICGEPMPPGEEMFNFHGYSGDCPKPPLRPTAAERDPLRAEHQRLKDAVVATAMVDYRSKERYRNGGDEWRDHGQDVRWACAALAAFEAQHPEVK